MGLQFLFGIHDNETMDNFSLLKLRSYCFASAEKISKQRMDFADDLISIVGMFLPGDKKEDPSKLYKSLKDSIIDTYLEEYDIKMDRNTKARANKFAEQVLNRMNNI